MHDLAVRRAMLEVDRAAYTSADNAAAAAEDRPISDDEGRSLMAPGAPAVLLEALSVVSGTKALVLGAGSAYLAAVVSRLAHRDARQRRGSRTARRGRWQASGRGPRRRGNAERGRRDARARVAARPRDGARRAAPRGRRARALARGLARLPRAAAGSTVATSQRSRRGRDERSRRTPRRSRQGHLRTDAAVRRAIARREALDDLRHTALVSGLVPMRTAALDLVARGVIPLTEVPWVLSAERMEEERIEPPPPPREVK